MDALHNHLFTDPLLRAEYPAPVLDLLREHAPQLLEVVRPGDLDVIAAPLDVLGVNDAPPDRVRADPRRPFGVAPEPVPTGVAGPEALTQTLLDLKGRYGDACPPLVVTGRGCALPDTPDADGRVRDAARIRSLEAHIKATRLAVQKGAPVSGYLAWTLMDSFEWADGFDQRFGLVHVDFGTQVRTRKDSFPGIRRGCGSRRECRRPAPWRPARPCRGGSCCRTRWRPWRCGWPSTRPGRC